MIIMKNNCDIPNYLNKDFFENALKNGLNCEYVDIKSLTFSMGSSGGENYLSNIYRVKVTYVQEDSSTKEKSIIVKSIPMDGVRKFLAELNIYVKEKQMYFDILPKLEDYLGDTKIAPKCFYAIEEPMASLVFEDMKVAGYHVADRLTGLDEKHSQIVLKKLGEYHATSMLLLEQDPSIRELKELKYGLFSSFSMKSETIDAAFKANLLELTKQFSKFSGYEEIFVKIANLVETKITERVLEYIRISSDDLIVLNHGDMWVNNFLYKYSDNNSQTPVDVVLIDFQGSYCGSPGLDLNYFLYTSPKLDVLMDIDNLIKNSYYASFRKVLEKGNYKNIPSFDDIMDEIRKKAFFGLFSSMVIFPIITMNKADSADSCIEKTANESPSSKKSAIAFASKRYLETMKYLLEVFDNYGLFD